MEKIKFPGTDKKASRVGLGTWALGEWMWGPQKKEDSLATVKAALDKGISLIDTAPAYGFGKSEEIVGQAVEEYGGRNDIIIATKVTLEWDKEQNVFRNGSRERIFEEIEDSLERLRTDYIDLYQVHWPDPLIPIEETAKAMKKLYDDGLINAIGVSNYSPDQMDEFRKYAPLHSCQPPYNMFEKQIENDILPYCKRNDIYLLTYGALCRGMLSGKMNKDREFKGDDLRNDDPKFQEPRFSQYLNAVEKLEEFAQEKYDKEIISFAVRWILDNGVETALWGARNPTQVEPFNEVMGWSLTEEDLNKIQQIIEETVKDPIGPEFMAPPTRKGK
ncbi:MAG: general stress protein [Candidatus Lokiarchaeota archaeon]|nr:general stress protein [Candidatus Lokiarchaeota archaeon]